MGGGEGAVGEFGMRTAIRRRRAQSANGRKEGRGAVGVVVSDSEEELEVLRQPNLIQNRKLDSEARRRQSSLLREGVEDVECRAL